MKLAIFDFDGTLFTKDTLPFLLDRWHYLPTSKGTYLRIYGTLIWLLLQFKLEPLTGLSREQMKRQAMVQFNRIFDGKSKEEVDRYFALCARDMFGFMNQQVLEEVKKAREEGYLTLLLSGTYEDLLTEIGRTLSLDTVVGSKLVFTQGRFDWKVESEIVIGQTKVKRILERFAGEPIDWDASKAYADSASDLDLLQLVGHPVAVRPEEKLKAIASEKGWQMIS